MRFPTHHPFRSEAARSLYLRHYAAQEARWPVPSRDVVVPTPFGPTYARISGPDGAPPLVLLPGMEATSLMWTGLVADLSAGRRTFAVDNVWDTGRSTWTRPVRGPADFAAWLCGLLDGLGLSGPVDVAGASYGAWIAAEHAVRHPGRVRRLVLLSPVGALVAPAPGMVVRALVSRLPSRFLARRFLAFVVRDLAAGNDADRALFEAVEEDAWLARTCLVPRRPVPPRRIPDAAWRGLRAPVLLLAGEDDRLLPVRRAARRLRSLVPAARVQTFAGAGHALFAVRPGPVARAMLDFLEETR